MLRFTPHYQPALWGGRRLEEEFGRRLPEGHIGESWELVELPERESRVAHGALSGQQLGSLWRAGALGGSAQGQFPFLLKWIDAAQKLSVQVHPDAAACAQLGHGQPKTEAWYVAYAEPQATLLVGHYPGLDAAALRQAALGNSLHKWLYETRPRCGDMMLLEAGTIHAIGAGFLLLEVQQPSDTTFRISDWGRLGADGLPRPLHVEDAAVSVAYARHGAPKVTRHGLQGPGFAMSALRGGTTVEPGGLRVFVADTNTVRLIHERGEEALDYGDVCVAEPADGPVRLSNGTAVLLSELLPASAAPRI